MLRICLVFWESELHYAYKRYAYKKTCSFISRDTSLSTSPLVKDGYISSTSKLTIFSAGSSFILFIVWTKLAESLMYDFPPKTNGFNSLETNFAIL